VADVMPEQFPQWFDAGQIRLFDTFIRAHLLHSERFVCISEAARRDVVAFAADAKLGGELDTHLITMGANFRRVPDDLARPASAPEGRYVLSVATIEPRKNHGTLLDAFEVLAPRHPDLALVFVGMPGWMTEATIERFRDHPEAGRRFRWLDRVDDDELDALYRHAFLCVQPSYYEGFGTPVIEALGNGIPTIASTGGALPEAGGTWAEYFEPDDTAELVALMDRHLDDPRHHEARRAALADYRPPTWEDGAEGIVAAFSPGDHPGGPST
jgi:glycosyltransferase involved in cell wall biosynthesis